MLKLFVMVSVDESVVSRSRCRQEMTRVDHNRLLSRFQRFEMSLFAKVGSRDVLFLLALSLEPFHKEPSRVTVVNACHRLAMVPRDLFALVSLYACKDKAGLKVEW